MQPCNDCGIESMSIRRCEHCGRVVCPACFVEAHESVLPLGVVERDFELEAER